MTSLNSSNTASTTRLRTHDTVGLEAAGGECRVFGAEAYPLGPLEAIHRRLGELSGRDTSPTTSGPSPPIRSASSLEGMWPKIGSRSAIARTGLLLHRDARTRTTIGANRTGVEVSGPVAPVGSVGSSRSMPVSRLAENVVKGTLTDSEVRILHALLPRLGLNYGATLHMMISRDPRGANPMD